MAPAAGCAGTPRTPGVRGCKSLPANGCCAVSPGLAQGSVTSRSPTSGPTLTHVPCDAQMRVLRSASKPKTKEGRGAQGPPSTTLRATFGTHPAESQAADASPARGIAAVINPKATTDAAMILRITKWGAVLAVPVLRPIPTPLSAELALGRRRIKRGRVETSWWAHRRTGWRGAQRPAMPCRRPWMPAILERHFVSCAGEPKLLYRAGADPNPRGQT